MLEVFKAVQRFCPVFFLCEDDQYGHPSSFDHFVQSSEVVCSETGHVLLRNVATDDLCATLETLDSDVDLRLTDPVARLGERHTPIDEVPVYCNVKVRGILLAEHA